MAVNPFGFTTGPVTFWLIVVYAAFLIPIVWIHETVPSVGKTPEGLNVTEAWHDLTAITKRYHPYNSRANEDVGKYLLTRIEETLRRNGVEWTREKVPGGIVRETQQPWLTTSRDDVKRASEGPLVTIFDDKISNVSYATGAGQGTGVYFEATNQLVYIRGTEDEDGEWWKNDEGRAIGKGGVLVNAHYDSVSTGYGATDDGMGCVSVLQMLNYYTIKGNQPKRGVVLLLNNGEEDGLFGAKAYLYSPLYHFTTTFVNLEGAGAGGRAILFRASDLETVRAYEHVRRPFGSVVAADGFNLGFIRSDTDYSVWTKNFGQRGLDIAFYRPRARYHTNQDDARHASQESLWHMLSNSFGAVDTLQKDTTTFGGSPPNDDKRKVSSGPGTDGVWFDMFGRGFAALALRGLFAWALTLLIVTPLVLFLVTYLLVRNDKYYFFSGKVKFDDDEDVAIGGWKGFFRFPFAFIVSAGLTIAAALLINKVNPQISHSSDFVVWATFLSLFFASFWTISKGASSVRPSALQRGYAHIWLFIISWTVLVVVTVSVDRMKIASGYLFAFLHSAVFVATLISLLDLFALPSKQEYARTVHHDQQARDDLAEVPNSDALISSGPNEGAARANGEEQSGEPTETTALLGGENGNHGTIRTTFTSGYRRSLSAIMNNQDGKEADDETKLHDQEQPWSKKLPSWTWFLQLLVLAPITLIVFGQVGVTLAAAIRSVSADGMDSMTVYLMLAVFSILVLLPVTPFIHRVTFYLPLFLIIVCVITLIYNLVAFPFSANNRLKVRFLQKVDLQDGSTDVTIFGVEKYVRKVIDELPSAAGQTPQCQKGASLQLSACTFDGAAVPPKLTGSLFNDFSKDKYADLVTVNVSRSNSKYKARLDIDAKDTKHCTLIFPNDQITQFSVHGNPGIEPLLGRMPNAGVGVISLWRREWSKPWTVDIEWDGSKDSSSSSSDTSSPAASAVTGTSEELRVRETAAQGPAGRIVCDWSDANVLGAIPALDEVLQYAPDWVAVTKMDVGLVQGRQEFVI
ncbi:peptidase family m28 family [Colletotrichum karsti]|uniref:Peptide hydrolase n=1 Tax=Colletotrichum karsti TaxID=1095194 RepID=A0A9P6HTI1_9PEZI|nr:peptidase family m28 family [Colletotrichum karsti]KAF9870773.1 peptidase family m28 family [Colletotrichum karsti]